MRTSRVSPFSIVLTALVLTHSGWLPHSARIDAQAPRTSNTASARTPWGDPDLQGTWTYGTMTPLERPAQFAGKEVLSEEEARTFEQQSVARRATANNTAGPDWWDPEASVLKNRRTSLVVDPADGRIPPLTAEAQHRAAARNAERRGRGQYEGPEALALKERCLSWESAGPPMLPAVYNNNVHLVQTPAYVVIVNEMIHDARIVPLDGRPHGATRRWMGDSRGHWEGATLVVDTINFLHTVNFRGSSEHLHLVERFTRRSPSELEYRFTVDDETVWTRPWTVSLAMTPTPGRMYEYACHEGNAPSVIGTLNGARVSESVR